MSATTYIIRGRITRLDVIPDENNFNRTTVRVAYIVDKSDKTYMGSLPYYMKHAEIYDEVEFVAEAEYDPSSCLMRFESARMGVIT